MKKVILIAAVSIAVIGLSGCADKGDGVGSKCGAQKKCGTEKKCGS